MKGLLRKKMPKIVEFTKENSLIFVVFNKLPSSTQRKLLDILLFFGKLHMQKMKIENPEEYAFLEKRNFTSFVIPLKISLDTLFAILGIRKNHKEQLVKAIDHLEEINYQRIDVLNGAGGVEAAHLIDNNEVQEILKKYGDKIKSWEKNRIIIEPKIDFNGDVFVCCLSPAITKFIIKNEKYTKINILVHTFLKSTYTINLYDILIAKFKAQKEMMDKGKITKNDLIQTAYFKLEELQDMLGLKKDHSWRPFKDFNKFILKPSVKEINESGVTEFEIVEVLRKKKGRKIVELAFLLKPKENFNIPALLNEQIILTKETELIKLREEMEKLKNMEQQENEKKEFHTDNNPIIKLKENILHNKNYTFGDFVKDLRKLKNVEITNVFPGKKGRIVSINELGLLEVDNEEIDNIQANLIRRTLFQNPDLLGKFEEIDEEFELLNSKFLNKVLVFKFKNYYYAIGVKKLEKTDDVRIKIIGDELLRNMKDFEIVFNIEYLKEMHPKEQLNTEDKDDYINYNNQMELSELEEFYEKNKDKFKDFLDYLEKESFKVNNELLELEENSKEFIEKAKRLETLDNYYMKSYELLNGENIGAVYEKMVLKKFKEFVEK